MITFWFVSDLYYYAIFEILVILIGEIVSGLYINDIHVNNINENININYRRESIFARILLCLGIGRIYFGVIPWNDNETLKSRYIMCKIWEMLFESMPSIGLSTYAIIVNNINFDGNGYNTRNTSALVSMVFSFINITNTIVNMVETDKVKVQAVNGTSNEIQMADIIDTNSGKSKDFDQDKQHNSKLQMVTSPLLELNNAYDQDIVKMLSILFIIAFVNNYDNSNTDSDSKMVICIVFLTFVCVLKYFSFKYLIIKDKFEYTFAHFIFNICGINIFTKND